MSRKRLRDQRRFRRVCRHEPDILVDSDAWSKWAFNSDNVTVCNWRFRCQVDRCPECDKITGGMGVAGCPCDVAPGWSRLHIEQTSRPHPAIKVAGRHRGRIERARRRKGDAYRYLQVFNPEVV